MDEDLAWQHDHDWEDKSIVVHWSGGAHVWEVGGKPVQDMRAMLATERAGGWRLAAITHDAWAAEDIAGRTYLICFERHIYWLALERGTIERA